MSMKNSPDTIGNRNRDLPAFNSVPQTRAPPRVQIRNLEGNNLPILDTTVFTIRNPKVHLNLFKHIFLPDKEFTPYPLLSLVG
jgi:hypothetical protein